MWWRRAVAVAALLLCTGVAQAQQPGCGTEHPWVEVVVTHSDPAFAARVAADLRAGLAATRIDTCERAQIERPRPLATVLVSASRASASTFSVDVTDSVTQKRLVRDVDLRDVPEDGRAFALAVAAEELLRASWAELSVRRPQPTRAEPPPAPPPAPRSSPPAPEPPPPDNHSALGLRFAAEHYTEGYTELGPDVVWGQALMPWLDLGVALGARRGLAVDAPHGSITALSVNGELYGEFRLLEAAYLRLDAGTGLRAARVWFSATADSDAQASDSAGNALYGDAGLVLSLGPPGFLRSRTRLGVGAPLKSFAVSDAGEVVAGMSGLKLYASTGVSWEF